MADKKISALTSATTPLAGTEVLPIVQSGATVQVSVNNLTIGKTVQTGTLLSGTSNAVGQITSFASATNDGAENAVSVMRFGTTYGSAIFHNYNSALNRETVNIAVSDGSGSPATNTLTKYRATADGSHYFYGATTSTLQMSVSSGNLILANGNVVISTSGKGAVGTGGAFLQTYGLVAAAGSLDLSINANGFVGTLSVSATRGNFNPQSTRTVFAVSCYGTTLTTTSLHTQNGSGGSNSFSVTCPSAGVVRVTDTSGYGSDTAIYITFHGAFNYLYA
jgi:hypothetical protein